MSNHYFVVYTNCPLGVVFNNAAKYALDVKTTAKSRVCHYTFYCSLRENTQSFAWNGTNSAKIHSLARKYEHLGINQIQLRFLHFNQHSVTLFGIHMRHWAYKRKKCTFINANIKVINTILKVNRDNWHTLKCKHYSLTFLWHCLQFNSIPGQL